MNAPFVQKDGACPRVQLAEVEEILSNIESARAAGKRAVSDGERWYYRRVADDAANYLADDVLQMRQSVAHEPPGRRVPPTLSQLKFMIAMHRRIDAAKAAVQSAEAALHASWDLPDGSWERHLSALGDAERKLAAVEREAMP